MKIVISGTGGLIGTHLSQLLIGQGHTVIAIPRDRSGLVEMVSGADAVVNLGGVSIASGRWTLARKAQILNSRVALTRDIVETMAALPLSLRPKVLVSASASGYYGNSTESLCTEESPPGTDFLARVCAAWEVEAFRAESFGVRTVVLRTALVVARQAPAIQKMLLPFRLWIGGPIGTGRQAFPFIHIDDLCQLIVFSLTRPQVNGPINAVAPEQICQRDAAFCMGKVLHRPALIPIPALILKLLLGEMSVVLLKGPRVSCDKVQALGFKFHYPAFTEALEEAIK